MLLKIVSQGSDIAFSYFSEHPTAGFVDKVVTIFLKDHTDADRILVIFGADEAERGENGNTPFPEAGGFGKVVENLARLIRQPGPDNVRRGEVDQIPIIDEPGLAQIELVELLANRSFGAFKAPHQAEQGEQALFVVLGMKEIAEIRQRQSIRLSDKLAKHRNADAKKHVPFAVLAFAGLEETLQKDGILGIGRLANLLNDLGKRHTASRGS
jgi:hypothetical protein